MQFLQPQSGARVNKASSEVPYGWHYKPAHYELTARFTEELLDTAFLLMFTNSK